MILELLKRLLGWLAGRTARCTVEDNKLYQSLVDMYKVCYAGDPCGIGVSVETYGVAKFDHARSVLVIDSLTEAIAIPMECRRYGLNCWRCTGHGAFVLRLSADKLPYTFKGKVVSCADQLCDEDEVTIEVRARAGGGPPPERPIPKLPY